MHHCKLLVAALLAALLAAAASSSPAQTGEPEPVTPRAAPREAERIVVTATRYAMLAVDAPATLSIVTRQEIEARGADNVIDAIRGETGLTLQGRAIGGRQVVALRGLDSKHTLFLVDGRRIAASDGAIGHSDFQYDWIAVEDIERIEIVRGPLSVLYGSEALGGVVNVITRQPGARWQFGATLAGSRAEGGRGGHGHAAAVRADGPLGEGLGLRAGVADSRSAAVASPADARISELEGRDRQEGWLGLVWQAAAGQRLEAEHREGREERWADARERSGARRYHVTRNFIDRAHSALGWEAQWAASGPLAAPTTQLRAYRSLIDVVNERTEGVAINPPQRLVDQVLEGQARAGFGAQTWTTGFEARNEALHDPGLPGGRSLAQHRALFVQDEWVLDADLRLTLGLRHDRHQLFGEETSPRAYAVWKLGDGLALKGGYSHGFKAPNLKQIVPGARREGPNTFLGNPALQPETSDAVEIGLGQQQPAARARAGWPDWQLVLFEQRVRDLIDVQLVTPGPAPGTGTYTYANLTRATLRGLEASVNARLPAGFGALVSYNYLDAVQDSGQRLDKRPRHSAAARLDWQQGAWRAGLRVEYSADQRLASATVGAPSVAAPDLTLVSAHAGWALPLGLELALGVDNLTDVSLADKSALFQQAEAPRTWRLTLRGRW